MRWVASVCLLLASCSPVLLHGDDVPADPSMPVPLDQLDASAAGSGGMAGSSAIGEPDAGNEAVPTAVVMVMPVDCGRCFDLLATGAGGTAPYRFEWEDGSLTAERRVCPATTLEVSVIVQDAIGARSLPYVTRLQAEEDASCPLPPEPGALLCLENPSFEGVPAFNSGLPEAFDASPWSACTSDGAANTPDIGNVDVAQTPVPPPTDGETFLALGQGEQASQTLCESMGDGDELSVQIDLARHDVTTGGLPVTGTMYVEVWGALSANCERRQLLWASPPLGADWTRYCFKLRPDEAMDQITIRANGDSAAVAPAFVFADNLVPVDACP